MNGAPPPPPRKAPPRQEAGESGSREPSLRPTIGGAGGLRKKGAWVRAWLLVDPTGQAQMVEAGKQTIMRRTGLPARDLRIIDPVLSYPSTVLGREKAIVVNLEHIKAIITAQEVLFLNLSDPLVNPFVQKLQGIFRHHRAKSPQKTGVDGNDGERTNLYNMEETQTMFANPNQDCDSDFPNKNEKGNADEAQQDAENPLGLKLLPFEFVALEACLEVACSALDNEASGLEQETHSALDKLTSNISTLNLDRVRQIKSRLVAITGRVQKVRDELEHLLDDDGDMAEMYLTEKFEEQHLENCFPSPTPHGLTEEEVTPDGEQRTPIEMTGREGNASVSTDIHETDKQHEQLCTPNSLRIPSCTPNSRRMQSHRTIAASMHTASPKHLDVEELEMILEAYFVQIEGTLNKLSNLREYVDDTEDYINIMLDDKQNHLLQMGVMLSTASVVLSAFLTLTGVFGMNITIELFDKKVAGDPEFLWTIGGGTIATVFLYVAVVAWCKHKGLF